MRLDIPPIDDAYAIPKKSAISKFLEFALSILGRLSLIFKLNARHMGSSISVVDVFITHILIKKEIAIKMPTIPEAELLNDVITERAILLCSPDDWMAKAKMKPPKNKYTLGLAYDAAASLKLMIPIRGNKAKGKRAVTGRGIDSVPHQTAISTATAATSHA